MALVVSASPPRAERKSPPHLLTLPFEIRAQIIFQTLWAEILDRGPYPFGMRSLPFDRPLLAIFSKSELRYMEEKHWRCPAFWGKEPMTRLMRANRQLYEEVYSMLWRDFSIHLPGMNPKTHEEWFGWLQKYNPRAIREIRYLHIRVSKIVKYGPSIISDATRQEHAQAERITQLQWQIGSYPAIKSVNLQMAFVHNRKERPSDEALARCLKQYLEIISICENIKLGEKIDVKVLYNGNPKTSWGRDIVKACQESIGQDTRLTPLLEWHMKSFPWISR